MIEKKNFQMRDLNTLKLSSIVSNYYEVCNEQELTDLFSFHIKPNEEFKVLGGGSNIWLNSDTIPLVIKCDLKGTDIHNDEDTIFVSAKAGENWSQFVEGLVSKGIGGLEFLIDIPGTVGAAPIQNIGAYGVEVGEYITHVRVFDAKSNTYRELSKNECQFSYRDSIFKRDKSFVVTEVFFAFNKSYMPVVNNTEIKNMLSTNAITIDLVLNAVRQIRKRKIPDYITSPNAGSFFKNPVVSKDKFKKIKDKFTDVVHYELESGIKISAAWLIEKSGWKGKLINGIGMSSKHALILVNLSTKSEFSVSEYVKNIKEDVLTKFNIELEVEPVRW